MYECMFDGCMNIDKSYLLGFHRKTAETHLNDTYTIEYIFQNVAVSCKSTVYTWLKCPRFFYWDNQMPMCLAFIEVNGKHTVQKSCKEDKLS